MNSKPYFEKIRAEHATEILAVRQLQRDNGIELQGQEKIPKMLRPRCLNEVATSPQRRYVARYRYRV